MSPSLAHLSEVRAQAFRRPAKPIFNSTSPLETRAQAFRRPAKPIFISTSPLETRAQALRRTAKRISIIMSVGNPGVAQAAAAAAAAVMVERPIVIYPEYEMENDFSLWLSGYIARVRSAFGFKLDETNKVKEEVVLSISGKLSVGPALNTYNLLCDDDKKNYERLVARLTEEFTDPRAKRKFNACMHYNVRKKNQSLKDFMQTIIKDIGRYSHMPATIVSVAGGLVPNPEREMQGVRRFIEGIRNEKGKIDDDFKRHLEYHLQDETEMNWENAIKVASRYETVFDTTNNAEEENDDDPDSDEVKEVETKKTKAAGSKITISALVDQVEENQERISKIESALDRMAAAQEQLAVAQEATNAMMQEMMTKLDLCLPMAQDGFYNY